jgi:hypothetical protein
MGKVCEHKNQQEEKKADIIVAHAVWQCQSVPTRFSESTWLHGIHYGKGCKGCGLNICQSSMVYRIQICWYYTEIEPPVLKRNNHAALIQTRP